MKTNYHTHTYRCKHACGTELDYVNAAIESGLSVLGFSDHMPFKDDRHGLRMDFKELTEYVNIIKQLKITKKKDLTILLGLECEYDINDSDYYEELLTTYNMDYLILGQHFYTDSKNNFTNVYFFNDTFHYIEYANSVAKGIASGYFKILAHPDVIFINDCPWDYNCEKATDIILSAAVKHDIVLEFNANGIRKGQTNYIDGTRYAYPHPLFWNQVNNTNSPVIINSDCHDPKYVFDESMKKAHDLAKEWGIKIKDHIDL